MTKYVVKSDRQGKRTRITIPQKLIKKKGWDDVRYFMLEDNWGERIVLRRFIDAQALEEEDS